MTGCPYVGILHLSLGAVKWAMRFDGLQQGCRQYGQRNAVCPIQSSGFGWLKLEFGWVSKTFNSLFLHEVSWAIASPLLLPLFPLKKGAQQGSGTQMVTPRLWPTCFWLVFCRTFPLDGPCAPCVPSTAALLRLQYPGCFAQQLSHFLGIQPGREVLGADGKDKTSRQLSAPSPACPDGPILGCSSYSPQQIFWGVLPGAWQWQMVRAVWTPSLPLAMFTCLNLTPQPASSILSWPVLLWLSCGSGSCCSVSWLPRAGGLPLAPSPRRTLALSRSWASQFSPLVDFIFKSGCTALGTGGSLVLSSLASFSIYFTVGFRKSPLILLQPTAVFFLDVVAHKWRPGILTSSLDISKGMESLSAPLGTPVVGSVGASP